jgi:hypothetical protein
MGVLGTSGIRVLGGAAAKVATWLTELTGGIALLIGAA